MVVIRKNWQALPVSATTVTAPIIEDRTPQDPIQWPTAHLSSEPNILELHKINYDEQNEPAANAINICDAPPPVQPKKRSWIIEQQGLLDQFSFSSSSVMIGGAVLAGLVLIMSSGKGTVKTRIGQDSLSGFY